MVHRVRPVAEQHRDRLGQVQDAAAADGDDGVRTGGPRLREHRARVVHQRLAGDPRDGDRLDVAQQVPVPRRVAARAQQHPRAEGGQQSRELRRAARAEHDLPGQREVERSHQPSSAGNTAVNRVDDRGCAIIPATASRQRA